MFLIDTTSSLEIYIKAFISSLKHNIIELKKDKSNRRIQIACVFYKEKSAKNDLEKPQGNKLVSFLFRFFCCSSSSSKSKNKKKNIEENSKILEKANDNEYLHIIDFTTDYTIIENELSKLKCGGGGKEKC